MVSQRLPSASPNIAEGPAAVGSLASRLAELYFCPTS
jgi:hypothetical protein